MIDWTQAERQLAPAIDLYGESTFPAVRQLVEAGEAHMWQTPRASAVSETVKSFHIWLGGGSRAGLLEMEQSAHAHAKAWGCDRMTIIGRKGWERVMAPLGYRPVTLLVKDI